MNFRFLKYILAYIIPVSALISFQEQGIYTYSTLILAFGIIPILELFIKPDSKNIKPEDVANEKSLKRYSMMIYLAVPVQIFCLVYFLETLNSRDLKTIELAGVTSAMGIMCGVFGINIGHELGHRSKRIEQFLAEILLLTSLENHFLPYHNFGHHLNIGTKKDAATARKNEMLFVFWFRSHFTSYKDAWIISSTLSKRKKSIFAHKMVWYTFFQLVLCYSIYAFYGISILLFFIVASIFGILLLETVNYIEHYGLLRSINEKGKFERVQPAHSWNSDHILGRLLLFELSRHSDHHYLASKHYQILDSIEEAPQMPTGYPGMMLLSLIPPLWFFIMNKRIKTVI